MQRLASRNPLLAVLTALALALTQDLAPGQIPRRVAVGYVT
jgi:hypothetical protein